MYLLETACTERKKHQVFKKVPLIVQAVVPMNIYLIFYFCVLVGADF